MLWTDEENDSSHTKFQVLAWMIIISRKRNLNQLENCQKYTHRLSWNTCIWHGLIGLTFHDQWFNFLDQSLNGQEHVINVQFVWFHTFITQVTIDDIVMWVTRLSIVDWTYSKTQILLMALRIQNQPWDESYISLTDQHFVLWVGFARSKRQYPTALSNQKSFRWMLEYEWMDYLFLIYGMWR